jgi:hypothetical protein
MGEEGAEELEWTWDRIWRSRMTDGGGRHGERKAL